MKTAYLILGGNIGDTAQLISKAINELESMIGKVIYRSSIYRTTAWGNSVQNDFLNCVVGIPTLFSPQELLQTVLDIEKKLGRIRTKELWQPRTIDIDILFFGDEIIASETLSLPHPRLHLRKFTLIPLAEVAPDLVHPVLQKTVIELLHECSDTLAVIKL